MEQPDATVSADVHREVVVDAPPEVVFAYFTEPERMQRWMGVSVDLAPRPGGGLSVDVNGRDVGRGEFVEVVPYSRVVFTWGWDSPGHPVPPGSSTVEVTLRPQDGGTVVHLRHTGLPESARADHGKGWEHYLSRLRVAAPGGDPGPDPMLQAAQS